MIYCNQDPNVVQVANNARQDIEKIPYECLSYKIVDGTTYVTYKNKEYKLQIFGHHNLMNMNAGMQVCKKVGITNEEFLSAMESFEGASKRLEILQKLQHL